MALLDGVRIGPLDPDRAENMGQVGGQSTARTLIRHHVAMHPPALVGALSRERQEARSKAVHRDEAMDAVRAAYEENGEPLPDEAEITGFAVRGHEDVPDRQVLTFTWTGSSGRSGKGAMPYRDNALSKSVAAGNEAVRIEELKAAGLPWQPGAVAGEVAGITGTGITASGDDGDELRAANAYGDRVADENETLRQQVEELRERLAAVETQERTEEQEQRDEDGEEPQHQGTPSDSGVTTSPQTPEGGSADLQDAGENAGEPELPWEGFEGQNAQEIRARLRENRDPAEAQRVLTWEQRSDGGGNRSTVVAAANEVLDRSGG